MCVGAVDELGVGSEDIEPSEGVGEGGADVEEVVFEQPIELAPAQILLVGFDKERGFVLRGVGE